MAEEQKILTIDNNASLPCACALVFNPTGKHWSWVVEWEFCPLHAAAPRMREALDQVEHDYMHGNIPESTGDMVQAILKEIDNG